MLLSGRVPTDDEQSGPVVLPFVAGARGHDEHVAGADLERLTARPAERHAGRAADDPERFVGVGVKVVIREDSVPPCPAPAVRAKQALAGGRVVHDLRHIVVNDDREPGVIRDPVARLKNKQFHVGRNR